MAAASASASGMERFRAGQDGGMERVNMADVLQLLLPRPRISRDDGAAGGHDRGFKCKTCNRRFPTFQALGGHSTSHRKQKPDGTGGTPAADAKPKVHGCSICGLEFTMGQALGGHMRRHRSEVEATGVPRRHCPAEKHPPPIDGPVCVDLNLPPSVDHEEEEAQDAEMLTLGL